MKNRKMLAIVSMLFVFVASACVFLKNNRFLSSMENDVLPDVATDWYRDYTYTKDDDNKTITLTKYNGTATEVYVPKTATISSKSYSVIISGGIYRDNTGITSVEFESGVKAGTTLAHLFDGCTSLTIVKFNGMTTDNVTNMSYMINKTAVTELDISSFNSTNATNLLYVFNSNFSKIKLGNFNFKMSNIKGYPFGRGTWIREEDGEEYNAVDLALESSSRDISGTYRKVRNIVDEMSISGSVTYKLGPIESFEDFTTTNSTYFGFTDNKYIYLKNVPSEEKTSFSITGDASVVAKNVVSDINDNKYHLKITLSNVKLYDLKTIDGASKLYGGLLLINSNNTLALRSNFYKTLANFRNDENIVLRGATTDVNVKLEILDQNNEPVSGNYLFSVYDLDTPSPKNPNGLPSHSEGEGYGSYSEGIKLLEGYDEDSLKMYSKTFLKKENGRIYGSHMDMSTELSEMIIKVNADNFGFNWKGSDCGTNISGLYQPQTVEIIKQDENGTILPGAQLSLYDNSNNLVSTWTTTSEHKLFFLNPGKYTLKENTTPEGYEKANDLEFYIDTDGSIIIDYSNVDKVRMTDNFKRYSYIVNYLDKETNRPIHDPKNVNNVIYNAKIKSSDEIININNYKYNSADKEELTIDVDNNIINLYYDRIKGGVVEKHIDEINNTILYEENHTLPVGDEYNIPSKTFEKYKLIENKLPTNAKGIVTEEGQEVIYYYRKIVNVITKVNGEGGTIEGDEPVLETDDSTPNKIVIKADENHYIEKVTINGEKIKITNINTMILENFKTMIEDKLIEVSFGDIIQEVPKTDNNTILPIIAIFVLIVGLIIIAIQTKKVCK